MIPWLPLATTLINLVALLITIWLGLYLVTRSFHSRSAWLAALTLWSIASWFLHNALQSSLPDQAELRWIGWVGQGVKVAPVLWYHLSWHLRQDATLITPRLQLANRIALTVSYGLVLMQIMASELTPGVQPSVARQSVRFSELWVSPSFPVLMGIVILFPFAAVLNLSHLEKKSPSRLLRMQYNHLLLATALAYASGLYIVIGTYWQLHLPTFPADILLGMCVAMIGYSVAEYNALLAVRPLARDARYSLAGTALVALLYTLLLVLLYARGQLSLLSLVLILVWAVFTHALYDGGRTLLDRIFHRATSRRLRRSLRQLARTVDAGGTLTEQLADLWNRLRKKFKSRYAIVAIRQEAEFVVVAASDAEWMGRRFALQALAATEPVDLIQGTRAGLPKQALLIPIYGGAGQLGALLLGPKTNKRAYLPEEVEYLEGLSEQVADLIQAAQQQEAQATILQQEVERYQAREQEFQQQMQELLAERPAVATGEVRVEEQPFLDGVEDALRHMHQFAYLGQHPVAQLRIVQQLAQANAERAGVAVTHIERGKALHELLVQAVEKLRPAEKLPAKHETPAPHWQSYLILHNHYIQGEPTTDIMSWLYISESNYNRKRKRAAHSVARTLQEMEQHVAQE